MRDANLINRPVFSNIDISKIEQQLDALLAHCRSVTDALKDVSDQSDWQTIIQPLDEAHNALHLFWSPVSHLNSVMNSDELRSVYKDCLPKLSAYYTELGPERRAV